MTRRPVSYTHLDVYKRQALDGAKQLEDGTDVLSSGAKDLYEGTVRLQTGSNKLAESLNSRFVPGLQAASDKQAALESSMTAIGKQIETLSLPDIEQLKNSLSEGIGTIVDQVSYHSAQAAVEQTASLCQDAISDLSSNAQLLALLKEMCIRDRIKRVQPRESMPFCFITLETVIFRISLSKNLKLLSKAVTENECSASSCQLTGRSLCAPV